MYTVSFSKCLPDFSLPTEKSAMSSFRPKTLLSQVTETQGHEFKTTFVQDDHGTCTDLPLTS